MDDLRTDRAGGDLRANAWLNGVAILVLLVVAFVEGIHAWDGGSVLIPDFALRR